MAASARITIRLPKKLEATLRRRSKLEGKAASDVVREALTSHLHPVAAARDPLVYRRSGKEIVAPPGSALEAFLDLGIVGCAKGLPSDLATNKKYMEGFGESREKRTSR